jgi:PAS domain S-box-containing protein
MMRLPGSLGVVGRCTFRTTGTFDVRYGSRLVETLTLSNLLGPAIVSRPEAGSNVSLRTLYANVDQDFCDLVRTKLEGTDSSIEVSSTSSIEGARRTLASERIDCLVTAYSLEDGTGIDLTTAVRAEDSDIPIILFTGQGTEAIASESTRAGVTEYIPIRAERDDFDLLARRIKSIGLTARQRRDALQLEDRFRRTLERITDDVYAVDSQWRFDYMNDRMAERVGRDPDTVIGNTLWSEFPSLTGTELEDRFRTAMETRNPISFATFLREPFGENVEIRAFPDGNGLTVFSRQSAEHREGREEPSAFVSLTDSWSSKRENQRLAEEYETLLENSGDAIFLLDVDSTGDELEFRFNRLSPGYETQTGLTTEEVRNETPRAVFGEERGVELESNYRRCVERQEPVSYREELPIAQDARFWETSLAPVIVDGEIVRVIGIARNVTQQVERERTLEETNERLESLIQAAPLTIMEIDSEGTVVLWNEGAEEMFGWSRAEVIGEFNPIVPEDRRAEFLAIRRRAMNGERIRAKEISRKTKGGERLDLLLSVTPLTGPDGDVTSVLAVIEDITNQKRLEARLRSLQETAQQLSHARSVDEIGSIAVDATAEILGFEITGIWEYDDRSDALVPITESQAARDLFGQSPRYDPGGSLAWDAFESGELRVYDDVQMESRRLNEETEIRSEIFVPLGEYGLLSAGSPASQVFSETDVDLFRILGATVEAALARASREAALQRQNERLDQFASVVAHDLRNPLTVATGFLEVAEQSGDSEHFEKVADAHQRIEDLIDDLLTLARGESQNEDAEEIDFETVATTAWGYVDTDEATLGVSDEIPTVAGDAGRLIQVFENLFRNAIEHGGEVERIEIGPLEDSPGFYVEDDGVGIPPDRREEVFKHGVSSTEGGTGFGLSIVADVATAHGWEVGVTDGTTGGALFEFLTDP